jgi:PAS domain S-box-containing protein
VDQSIGVIPDPSSFLRSLLSASGDCIKVLDLAGNLIFMTEGGQRVMEVTDFSLIRGCPWPDFWQGQGNTEAKAAVEAARNGRTGHFHGFATTMAGTPKWWDVTVTPIPGADGKPHQLLSISRDITASHMAARELQSREQQLRLALDAADTGTWDLNPRSAELRWDRRCYELFGLTFGQPISYDVFLQGLHPDDRDATDKACREAMVPGGSLSYDIEYRTIGLEDGVQRWCSAKGRSIVEDGDVVRFIGTIRDIGKLKNAEAQQQMLTRELEHRMKNTMAMVGAIANQTFRTAATKEDARTIFEARLSTLNKAHDALTQSSWTSAPMTTVVEGALLAHRSGEGRIRTSGPDIILSARQALSLALALHELATNAVKYGALSTPTGTIDVTWDCSAGNDPVLQFMWRESGGPVVAGPTRRGFGSRLIESTLSADFGGSVMIEYLPAGVICRFESPLSTFISASEG